VEEAQGREAETLKQLVLDKAQQAYAEREAEYPVMAGLFHFTHESGGQKHYDREKLVAWARDRFHVDLNLEDLKSKQRDEVRELLVNHSRQSQQQADQALAEVRKKVATLFGDFDSGPKAHGSQTAAKASGGNGALVSLSHWLHDHVACDLSPEALGPLGRDEMEQKLTTAVEDYYRPEIRKMERALVLQLLDTAWKDHLLAMDHLKSSVGLRGYAQVDPKVEYKREGMRTFELMWTNVGERVTDLIFRMEQLDENFVGSTWVASTASHESPPSTTSMGGQDQETAINRSDVAQKMEPIRNRGETVGRNDPCPCGSGKKYKNCCMRKRTATSD
jgi:preprotein translocase subunit SecA